MKITHLEITTSDVVRAASFYAEVLGLAVRPLGPGDAARGGAGVSIQAGSTSISLIDGPTAPGSHHLAFTVAGRHFEDAVAHVARRVPLSTVDGRTTFEGNPHWNSRSVYFAGPDDAVLELIERRELRDDGEDASSIGITCLSEVGLPAPDVEALVAELVDTCGLAPFGLPSPTFAPVGDHHGLLICVTPDRLWWPEQLRHPHGGAMRITMSTPCGVAELDVAPDLGRQLTPP